MAVTLRATVVHRIRLIGALHTLFSSPRLERAPAVSAMPSAEHATAVQLFAQWGACPFSSSVARSTVSGWLLSSDQTGCDAMSSAILRLRERSGLLAPGSAAVAG